MQIPAQYPIVELISAISDARGDLQPLVDDLSMRSAILINSKSGAIRANHYHKTDWHYCFLLEGAMEYGWRNVGEADEPEIVKVTAGQMIYTPALVEHAMLFTADSRFLALSGNPRDQRSYEDDLVRVELFR